MQLPMLKSVNRLIPVSIQVDKLAMLLILMVISYCQKFLCYLYIAPVIHPNIRDFLASSGIKNLILGGSIGGVRPRVQSATFLRVGGRGELVIERF